MQPVPNLLNLKSSRLICFDYLTLIKIESADVTLRLLLAIPRDYSLYCG